MQPTERFVEGGGLKLHLLEWDGGGRTTLLCVHGFLDQAWSMLGLARALPATAHVVALDLRGHGDSDWIGPGGYYHAPDYVLDLSLAMAAVRRDKLVLVGHSLGGMVSAYTTGTYPDRVDGLVMIEGLGAPGSSFEDAPLRYEAFVRTVNERRSKSPRPLADLEAVATRLGETCPRIGPGLLAEIAPRAVRPAPGGGWLWKYDPLHRTRSPMPFYWGHFAAFLSRIACPTLLVEAVESEMRFTEEETARRAAFVRHHRRALVPGAGHMAHVEAPAACAAEIAGFLAQNGL